MSEAKDTKPVETAQEATESQPDIRSTFDAIRQQIAQGPGGRVRASKDDNYPEAEVAEDVEEAPEAEVEESQQEPAPDLAKVKGYLRLKTSIPKSVLEKASPEDLTEWESDVRERETRVDETFKVRSELEKRIAELEKAATPSEPAVPAESLDLDQYLDPLKSELGEEAVKVLKGMFDGVVSPLRQSLHETRQQLEDTRNVQLTELLQRERSRVGAQYSHLSESDDAWSAVTSLADKYLQAGDVLSLQGAYDKAVQSLYGDIAPDPDPAKAEEHAARRKATPTTKTRRPRQVARDPMGKAKDIFKLVKSHKHSQEEINDIARRMEVKT